MACAPPPRLSKPGSGLIDPLALTWSSEPSARFLDEVRAAASRWALPVWPRARKQGLAEGLEQFASLLVHGGSGWKLVDSEGALGVTPGLAMLRLKRLAVSVERDALLRHAQVRAGDRIVDATIGLGADARVLAAVAGARGHIVGLEASKPLAVLLAEGLRHEQAWPGSAALEVQHARAGDWLAAQPAQSVDIVFFDPMFDRPRHASPDFEVLRRHAVNDSLSRDAIDQAKRVARRLVLMKAGDPTTLAPLGLSPLVPGDNANVFWGAHRHA